MNTLELKKKIRNIQAEQLLIGLGTCLFALMLIYGYLLCASVVHVVMREEIQQEAEQLLSDISNLEARYIREQHAINEAVVVQHGFSKTQKKIFIDRTTDSLVLSSLGN